MPNALSILSEIFGARAGFQDVGTDAIYLATVWALPVIIAITFHEAAHGFVAHLLGDDTAWRLGDWLRTGPQIWMDLQSKWDLWHTRKTRKSA